MPKTLSFNDEFTIRQIPKELPLLEEAVAKCAEVVLDIVNVREVDVAAVQILIAAQKESKRNDHRITSRNPISSRISCHSSAFDSEQSDGINLGERRRIWQEN